MTFEEYLPETNKILDDMGFIQTTKGIPSTVEELDSFRIEVEKRIKHQVREAISRFVPQRQNFAEVDDVLTELEEDLGL